MAGYDPKKAAEYNRLIQQGVTPEAAIAQAGITYEEQGNYEINSIGTEETNRDYGRMSDIALPQNNTSGVNPASDPSQFPAYDDDGNLQPGFAINDENGGTYYRGFPSQDVGTALPVSNPYYGLTPTQLQDLGGADPTDPYIRARLGIPQLPGSTLFATGGFGTIKTGVPAIDSALGIIGKIPTLFSNFTNTVGGLFGPKPTATAAASTTGMSVAGLTTPTPAPPTTDTSVNPASDPSQFPAYDDDGNLQPGFAINDEDGGTYYRGFERTFNNPLNPNEDPFEQSRYEAELAFNAQEPNEFAALTVNDPYYGLTSQQLQDLGGADPTDPYIRARLGIPQLPDSTLAATPGFGTIKTGVPIIDNALNFIGGLFGSSPATPPTPAAPPVSPTLDPSQFPAYDDDGNLQPGFAINDEDGRPYYRGEGPPTQQSSVTPASDPSQFPAYDDDGNLQPGFAINDENGGTYYRGFPQPTSNDAVAIDANSGYGSEVGSAPLDVAEVAGLSRDATTVRATNPDLSPEAQANLDGINAANAEIVKAQGNIQSNNLNILRAEEGIADARENQRQAEAIIEQNNAELADPFITDERRAELLENNALQEASIAEQSRYIIDQTDYIVENEANNAQQQDNILTNQVIAEENAAGFRANDGGELLTVEPNLDPELEQADEEVTVDTTDPTEVAALVDPGLETPVDQEVLTTDNATEVDAEQDPFEQQRLEAEQELNRQELAREATDVEPEQDPFEAARLEAEQNLENAQPDEFAPEEVDAEQDPFEQQRLEAEQELNRQELAREATDVEPGLFTGQTDEFGGVDEAVAIEQADVDSRNDPQLLSEEEIQAELDNQIPTEQAEDVDTNEDDGLKTPDGQEEGGEAADTGLREPTDADAEQANQESAVRDRAKQQATFQARYKQPGNTDWRVRLSLGPNATYLYNAGAPGILAPLAATDGVIFPYTPSITTTYTANYEQYDLVHSNYRGIYYKNSRVGDIQIRGTFTAQDTKEADYLLAVIHFFRSATKMFYGQDAERGTPPPVCLLNGLGQYQFSDHPVVISSFNYTLPNDVDYIRAGSPNNYGINLLNRRAAVASNPGGTSLAGLNRLTNALLKKGAPGQGVPDPSAIQQNVSNTAGASYVPTKIEIDITLIPVQTRSQVSKQFSLKGFANGQLLKGGFW